MKARESKVTCPKFVTITSKLRLESRLPNLLICVVFYCSSLSLPCIRKKKTSLVGVVKKSGKLNWKYFSCHYSLRVTGRGQEVTVRIKQFFFFFQFHEFSSGMPWWTTAVSSSGHVETFFPPAQCLLHACNIQGDAVFCCLTAFIGVKPIISNHKCKWYSVGRNL